MSSRSASYTESRSENEFEFVKMHGCGNNFMVLSDFRTPPLAWNKLAIKLMDRNFGVGGDGVMVLRPAPSSKHDFEVLMYNPDGSAMGMCGNGIRCVARYVMLNDLIPPGREVIHFLVEGRDIACALRNNGESVMVDMGAPSFEPKDIPIISNKPIIDELHDLAVGQQKITCLSVGNPHCVIFVPSIKAIKLTELAPQIENDKLFPNRTNVEFVEIKSSKELSVRVWERGAGATLACGTAACAVLAAANVTNRSESSATIILPGGKVEVEWDKTRNRLYLTGPAREVYFGRFRVDDFIDINDRSDVN